MDKVSLYKGLKSSPPACLALFMVFASIGLLAHNKGLSLANTILMSISIFAAPLQALLLENNNESVWFVIINTFVLNFKFLLMSAAILPSLHTTKFRAIFALYFTTNSVYAIFTACKKYVTEPFTFYMGLALPIYIIAILATFIGYFLLNFNYISQELLKYMAYTILPIHFTSLAVKRKEELMIPAATLLGFILTPCLSLVIHKKFFIAIWISTGLGLYYIEKNICKN